MPRDIFLCLCYRNIHRIFLNNRWLVVSNHTSDRGVVTSLRGLPDRNGQLATKICIDDFLGFLIPNDIPIIGLGLDEPIRGLVLVALPVYVDERCNDLDLFVATHNRSGC